MKEKMKFGKGRIIIVVAAFIILSVILMMNVRAASVNFCCEKTTSGAWCQNAPQSQCDSAFRQAPTSCDATSYCRQGCCYDSQEGTCMESTPQLVCNSNGGTWANSATCDIPQCQLGCCVLDNQAAFVTLTRCKKLSSFYGLETDFRTNINSEADCIAVAQAQDRGACVYNEDFTRTCKFTTRQDCTQLGTLKTGNATTSNVTFYKDYLCSAEELGTNCGPTKQTTCVSGKDEVYFVDSCGNIANIYDSSRINDKSYWEKIVPKSQSCNSNSANANSPGCGNCDYYSGSFCRQYDSSKDKTVPTYGNSVCEDLNCYNTVDGKNYKNGESWCITDDGTGNGQDPAGSRYFKHVCIAGEEIVEPCADFRNEVCIQDQITTSKGAFQQAACRANRWQDCMAQTTQTDCENQDKRDCMWVTGFIGQLGTTQGSQTNDSNGEVQVSQLNPQGVCVPQVPPGLNFWTAGESEGICSQANSVCVVQFEKGLFGGSKKCVKNCQCLLASWNQTQLKVCSALGDCTGTVGVFNYLQKGGFGVSGTK